MGGAHRYYIDTCICAASMSPALNESSVNQILHVELSDALEIRNRTIFSFYPALLHQYHAK